MVNTKYPILYRVVVKLNGNGVKNTVIMMHGVRIPYPNNTLQHPLGVIYNHAREQGFLGYLVETADFTTPETASKQQWTTAYVDLHDEWHFTPSGNYTTAHGIYERRMTELNASIPAPPLPEQYGSW